MSENEKPPMGFFKKLAAMMATRFGMTLLSGAIITFITNSPAIVHGFRVCCSFVGMMGDEKVTKQVTTILGKGEEVAKDLPKPAAGVASASTPAPDQPPPKSIADTIKAERPPMADHKPTTLRERFVDPAKKTIETNAKKLEDKADNAKEELKDTANAVADKLGNKLQANNANLPASPPIPSGGTPQALPGQARDPGQQASGLMHDMGSMASGAINNNPVTRRLQDNKAALDKRKVELKPYQEPYAAWWAEWGLNGSCVKCRTPVRVSRAGNGAAACPRCGLRGKAGQFRAFPPPMPMEPPAAFWAWNRKREEAEQKKQEEKKQDDAAAKEKKP